MEDVATASGRGSKNRSMNGAGTHIPQVEQQHGSFTGSFDLEDGRLKSSPRTLIAIAIGMFVLGGGIAVALYRLNTIETLVSDIPAAIDRRFEQAEESAEQSRKIACLQQQIANKSWVCPDALQVAKEPEKRTPARQVTKTTKADPGFWSALAGGK